MSNAFLKLSFFNYISKIRVRMSAILPLRFIVFFRKDTKRILQVCQTLYECMLG
jgi:hypothetical protein